MTTETERQQIHDALFLQATEKMDELRYQKDCLCASHERLRMTLEAARGYLEYNIPATEQNGKLLYRIRETLAAAKGE